MRTNISVAMTPSGLMGSNGRLPWNLPEDLKHFKEITMGHALIMGRKTLDEIKKPLKGRRNMVITRNPTPPKIEGIEWFSTLAAALQAAKDAGEADAMIAGGSEIFRIALDGNLVDRLLITYVYLTPEPTGDTFFPPWDKSRWREVSRQKGTTDPIEFVIYERL